MMNKKELVKAVAQKLDITQKEVAGVVDAVLESIAEALKTGEEIKLTGFGKWTVVERAARQAHNPKTGEPVLVPAKKAVRFKPAKDLKEKVQG